MTRRTTIDKFMLGLVIAGALMIATIIVLAVGK
jgi:hypothetical protein